MDSFTTFNQFDSRFKEIGGFNNDRSACPFFALISAHNFMKNGEISPGDHETNLYDAISSYVTTQPPQYLGFEELLQYSGGSLDISDIGASTPELVATGVVGWKQFFPSFQVGINDPVVHEDGFEPVQNYCTIFLKNSNFFVVMASLGDKGFKFAVRDCHQNDQWYFEEFELLKEYLNQTYRFEEITIVDGVPIPEFDNIEFIVIKEPFQIII